MDRRGDHLQQLSTSFEFSTQRFAWVIYSAGLDSQIFCLKFSIGSHFISSSSRLNATDLKLFINFADRGRLSQSRGWRIWLNPMKAHGTCFRFNVCANFCSTKQPKISIRAMTCWKIRNSCWANGKSAVTNSNSSSNIFVFCSQIPISCQRLAVKSSIT